MAARDSIEVSSVTRMLRRGALGTLLLARANSWASTSEIVTGMWQQWLQPVLHADTAFIGLAQAEAARCSQITRCATVFAFWDALEQRPGTGIGSEAGQLGLRALHGQRQALALLLSQVRCGNVGRHVRSLPSATAKNFQALRGGSQGDQRDAPHRKCGAIVHVRTSVGVAATSRWMSSRKNPWPCCGGNEQARLTNPRESMFLAIEHNRLHVRPYPVFVAAGDRRCLQDLENRRHVHRETDSRCGAAGPHAGL